jgi:DNA-binding response OmpR family regulator
VIEQTAWTARLHRVPTWALVEELCRRGEEPDRDQAVRLPGLVVDPVQSEVTWRGDGYALGGRKMEVVYALALALADGRRRVAGERLARAVFRGFEHRDAMRNLSSTVHDLGQQIPGLLTRVPAGVHAAYGLALDAPTADRRTA